MRPDYRVLLIAAEGLVPGPSTGPGDRMLADAQAQAVARGEAEDPTVNPHVAAWHEAFRAFGAKPERIRPSVDALLRRAPGGLPRIDAITDLYYAVSAAHALPIGGEDLDRYSGPPHLVRARGDEPFEIMSGGQASTEHPRPGEVVWTDAEGVTCRRWNWRQCVRTRLTHSTTRAGFILDDLHPMDDARLDKAGRALVDALGRTSPSARFATRLLRAERRPAPAA
ncbi:B3/4 domain-containing protein [Actinomadura namibiensis]|uniref:DNA/RNA-binding domain of Phe-tRNA-synthetase-like protein n=1 Tax=Actinomadura namibiensis TaxID=182080 RepID=A0A7W3QQZ9_ACTNM|nr:phenylalanine--tRNA ligase beta subunit-related protein [Actinomadura namibiensis]MBA8956171.1 DNA/RNA-binding domain of Phe-tRNA-synthetase-like protein [Actinomadura namibiensis]